MSLPVSLTERRRRRARTGLLTIAGLLLILAAVGVDYAGYPYRAPLPGQTGDRGENGLWLRYTWYFGQHSDADVSEMAARLWSNRIRYAYFHVRSIERDGRLRYRYPEAARRLTTAVHRQAPGVALYAWIYAGNPRGMGRVDLNDPAVRQAMVAEARWLVTECGFDGVQWDYEICTDGEWGLIDLLRETRQALPAGKGIGVAAALCAPGLLGTAGYGWSDRYYGQLAALSDQIAVMDYDSAMYLPRAYVGLTAMQVRHACRAAAARNPGCRILIGVPTYEKGGASHSAYAENLGFALRGVREGLAELSPEERATFAGVAPFADYTTTAADWQAYRNGWLDR